MGKVGNLSESIRPQQKTPVEEVRFLKMHQMLKGNSGEELKTGEPRVDKGNFLASTQTTGGKNWKVQKLPLNTFVKGPRAGHS